MVGKRTAYYKSIIKKIQSADVHIVIWHGPQEVVEGPHFRQPVSTSFWLVSSELQLSERASLHSLKPLRVRMWELEGHHTRVPSALDGLLHACAEGSGVHEAAAVEPALRLGHVLERAGLADDEFVEVDSARAVCLEDGGASGAVEERVAVRIAGIGRLWKAIALVRTSA